MLIRDLPELNAIKVGNLYFAPGQVSETITQSCRMVVLEASDRSLPLGRSGSATLVKHAGQNFVLATRHQLSISSGAKVLRATVDAIRIASGKGTLSNIPLAKCIYEIGQVEEECHDVIAFTVAETWDTMATDLPYFFPIQPLSREPRPFSYFVGNPSLDVVMDEYLEEFEPSQTRPINIRRSIGRCTFDNTFRTHAQHYLRYTHDGGKPTMDGYSGGAVFSMIGEFGNYEIVLDGIILRAGEGHIHIVDADYLVRMLSECARR